MTDHIINFSDQDNSYDRTPDTDASEPNGSHNNAIKPKHPVTPIAQL